MGMGIFWERWLMQFPNSIHNIEQKISIHTHIYRQVR